MSNVLAHGIGTRTDLPVPVSLAATGAALAVVVSFVALAALWRSSRLRAGARGVPAPGRLQALADSRPGRLAGQSVTLVVCAAVVAIGLVGPADAKFNLAPWVLFVTFWVGLVPASLLLGPVWRVLNPLRAVHAGLARLLRVDPVEGRWALPAAVGCWPAALSLLAFTWYELVFPRRDEPWVCSLVVLGYAVVQLAAATVFGVRWFARGDGFEVWSTLLGAMAPLGRRPDGRLGWRGPLEGLDGVPAVPGLTAVVVTLVGSTAFDGLTRTAFYAVHGPNGVLQPTLLLLCSVAAVGLLCTAGTWAVTVLRAGPELRLSSNLFAHAVVPIAAGYAVAHYFSLLLFDGQQPFILASDPLGRGADLFGTTHRAVDYTLVSTRTIALVQVGAIVTGHVLAVVAAHDRAVRLLPYRAAVRSQYPLLGSMVALTLIAVGLVLGG